VGKKGELEMRIDSRGRLSFEEVGMGGMRTGQGVQADLFSAGLFRVGFTNGVGVARAFMH
jgi:hypothetical protein